MYYVRAFAHIQIQIDGIDGALEADPAPSSKPVQPAIALPTAAHCRQASNAGAERVDELRESGLGSRAGRILFW